MFPKVCVLFPRWGAIKKWWKLRNWGAQLEGLAHCGHGITGDAEILVPLFFFCHSLLGSHDVSHYVAHHDAWVHHHVQHQLRPRVMEPGNNRLQTLELGVKLHLS